MPQSSPGRLALIYSRPDDLKDFAETLWIRLREEAEEALVASPMLGGLFVNSILDQPSFEAAVFHRISERLKSDQVPQPVLVETFTRVLAADPEIAPAVQADIAAVVERDPACLRYIEPFLYFKGFHALQTHRVAHALWRAGERDAALYLQSRSSDVFQTDIHPAARFGRGIFLDHATGLVVGETAVVEDGVSMLQNVTLGGTGKEAGDRHPKVRKGVIIGAGAKILGNIEIGANSRIAAGAIVLRPVEAFSTVAGIPAKVIRAAPETAGRSMVEVLGELAYDSFDYTI